MLDFTIIKNDKTGLSYLETNISGKALLTLPQLNKGTAFSLEEREAFGLTGKLPHKVESIEEQVQRTYLQFLSYQTQLQRNIYLNNLHDKNQILFYKLLSTHLEEMLPTIYTPIVGHAVKRFSHEYRQPRGLYIANSDISNLENIISNRSNPNIDIIVLTDGEGVLGIGDQGIGGMDIPVAKLMVYCLCGGINPLRTLPIFLDVGTNNQELLNDPLYLGCKYPRIPREEYDIFIEAVVRTLQKHFPKVFLHWEDFGRSNARRLLAKYQDKICTFNDDIQGTGAVTLAALLSACELANCSLEEQNIVVFGAGSAGMGISDQILAALMRKGLSEQEAYKKFWLIDRQGLLISTDESLTEAQKPYARTSSDIKSWNSSSGQTYPSLLETIANVKPSILIGCSAQPGAFTKEIILEMAKFCEFPIIFPLSNPDDRCEAHPKDLLDWTLGKALIATGTAFPPVKYKSTMVSIAQCNNALVFPGIGLGITAVKAKRLSQEMIWAATEALANFSLHKKTKIPALLPTFKYAQATAKHIAIAVAKAAQVENLAENLEIKDIEKLITDIFWEPSYLPYKKI